MYIRLLVIIPIFLLYLPVATSQWMEIKSFPEAGGSYVRNISFLDGKDGFLIGGTKSIMRTQDYGTTWDTVLWVPKYLSGIQFISDTAGFAYFFKSNPEIIFKTTDRGATWVPVKSNHNFNTNMYAHFVNDTLGFVVTVESSKWYIYRTKDGGLNWNKAGANIAGGGIWSMAFFNTQRGFAAGCGSCSFVSTTNGGDSWKLLPHFGNYFFSFPDSMRGYTGGSDYIWRTDDAGENWVVVNDYDPILSLDCPSRDTCYGGGLYGIHKTTDGGLNWTYTSMPALNFKTISCPSNDTCYTASVSGNRIFRTFNGGEGGFVTSIDVAEELDLRVHFYPNPVNDVIHWASTDHNPVEEVQILDITGRLSMVIPGIRGGSTVSHLQPGIYIVRATMTNGHIEVHRFVKQ